MPNIDLSILNQRQTPAFYADVFANRPAAGFVGRIFVSTDTYAFYRDNGTGWDLIGGPGTGTVTGSGAAGQVAFWSGSSLISGENNLWWDSTNNHFGINTNTPGTALDVHHDQSTVGILNQTVATNDTRIAFQNSGVAKWRVGNFYNLGSNDYAVNDATLNINRFTIKSSSGQTFVGDETTSSGLFVVNNSSGDAHIVALGATAPSIRVRNAGVGASLQFGLGLATTTNNFIQGATGGEFCIFNDSLTAQPILFGIKDAGLGNTQEAARISAARNFLIGTTTDGGQKLQVNGTSRFSGFAFVNHSTASAYGAAIYNTNVNGEGLAIRGGSTSSHSALVVQNYDGSSTLFSVLGTGAATFSSSVTATGGLISNGGSVGYGGGELGFNVTSAGVTSAIYTTATASPVLFFDHRGTGNTGNFTFRNGTGASNTLMTIIGTTGNVGIGTTTPSEKLFVSNTGASTGIGIQTITSGDPYFRLYDNTTVKADLWWDRTGNFMGINSTGTTPTCINPYGNNVLIGTTTDNGNKLQVNGGVQSTNIIASSNLSYNRVGFTMVPSVDNATFTLQGTFPNIVFSNQFIAMRLLIMGTDTTNATSTIVNCVRDSGTTWATTIVNSTSVGSTLTPVITFGGTSAAPTIQITGAILNSVVIEIITR